METRTVFRTGLLNLLVLFAFLLLTYAVGSSLLITGGGSLKFLLLAGIVLVPSLVSALFYYFQDRLEPEPVSLILGAFLSGMAAAALGVIPFWHIIFRIKDWIYASSQLFILGSFLIMAAIVSFLLYAVIRYVFYPMKEFDEPVDGMVYGAVTGIGLAYVLSFHHLITRPDCTLFVIAYISTTHILIYSAVGSLIGYVLGQAKFQRKHVGRQAMGAVLIGTVLLGIYHLLNEFIFLSGFSSAFWLSFILTIVYALMVLSYGTLKMRTLTADDRHEVVPVCPRIDRWPVLLIAVILIAGLFVSLHGLRGKRFHSREYGISFTYPHSLSGYAFESISPKRLLMGGSLRTLFSRESVGEVPARISVRAHARDQGDIDSNMMRYVDITDTESLTVEDVVLGGKKGRRLTYSYIIPEGSPQEFPHLIQVYTDVVAHGNSVLVFSYKNSARFFESGLGQYQHILRTLRWSPPGE